MRIAAVVVAAGRGSRMGVATPKQLLALAGKPVLTHSLLAFENHASIDEIVLVVPPEAVETTQALAVTPYGFTKITAVVEGGASRQASVYEGLLACTSAGGVLIHDGARPLVRPQAIADIAALVRQGHCGVSGVRAKDTVKITNADGRILETAPREATWAVQTPQGFPYPLIWAAHVRAQHEGFEGTDDSALAERMGLEVYVVPGDYHNLKLTTPEDLRIAEALLAEERYI